MSAVKPVPPSTPKPSIEKVIENLKLISSGHYHAVFGFVAGPILLIFSIFPYGYAKLELTVVSSRCSVGRRLVMPLCRLGAVIDAVPLPVLTKMLLQAQLDIISQLLIITAICIMAVSTRLMRVGYS